MKIRLAFLALALSAVQAWADPILFGFTNGHEVVSVNTNAGTFLTSTSPFNAGFNNSGWWSPTAPNSAKTLLDNYFVGESGTILYNDFFTFFIPQDIGVITDATISLPRGTGNTTSGVPFTFSLYDVSTPAAVLNAPTGASASIYNDLGSGVLYGSILVTNVTTPNPLVLTLNANAIAGMNAARGSFFSMGGTLSPSTSNIPEPSSMFLFLTGLTAIAIYRRRSMTR